MPLGFSSINRGVIAFGFFNIETDLLLMEQTFLFASDFSRYMSQLASYTGDFSHETHWEVYYIQRREDVGDMTGAIHGIQYSGFIGDVYRHFPFPKRMEDFKQKPEGFRSRSDIEIIVVYSINW